MAALNDLEQKHTQIEPTVTSIAPSSAPSSHTARPSTSSFTHDEITTSKSLGVVESARLAVTILVILLGITVLSCSADVVSEYNKTHLSADFLLPLWGEQDIRGEIAILVGGAVVIFVSGVGLFVEKLHAVCISPPLVSISAFFSHLPIPLFT